MRLVGFSVVLLCGAAHAATTPVERATALVAAQLAAVDDPAALLATLAPDALILGNGAVAIASEPAAASVVATLARSGALEADMTRLDAGGTSDAVWIHADVALIHAFRGSRSGVVRNITHARITELVVSDGARWNVIAFAFVSTGGDAPPNDALPAPGSGPLAALLADPSRLEAALLEDDSTIAIRDGEVALGLADVRRFVEPWRERDVAVDRALEVHTRTWGYVAADLALTSKAFWEPVAHTRVLVLAILDSTGRWHVVSIHAM